MCSSRFSPRMLYAIACCLHRLIQSILRWEEQTKTEGTGGGRRGASNSFCPPSVDVDVDVLEGAGDTKTLCAEAAPLLQRGSNWQILIDKYLRDLGEVVSHGTLSVIVANRTASSSSSSNAVVLCNEYSVIGMGRRVRNDSKKYGCGICS